MAKNEGRGKVTSLRLSDDLRARLDAYAADTRRTLLASVELLLDEGLSRHETQRAMTRGHRP